MAEPPDVCRRGGGAHEDRFSLRFSVGRVAAPQLDKSDDIGGLLHDVVGQGVAVPVSRRFSKNSPRRGGITSAWWPCTSCTTTSAGYTSAGYTRPSASRPRWKRVAWPEGGFVEPEAHGLRVQGELSGDLGEVGILQPPMMRTSTPDRDVARTRAEEDEEALIGSFSKKTPPKKITVSDRRNHYTFRSVLAMLSRSPRVRGASAPVECASRFF